MTLQLQIEISLIFLTLFIVGSAACLPLYHGSPKAFMRSRLWTKVYWWWPIFAVFCIILWLGGPAAFIVAAALIIQAAREFSRQRGWRYGWVAGYGLLFLVCLLHLPILNAIPREPAVELLVSICFASVLSDVFAFFAGSYLGRHHLPAYINAHKSYEGVAGQVVGAVAGLALVSLLPEIGFSWWLAVGIGVASAAGDLINSIAKRCLGIKDWGDTIPGHGGILDRFSSLSFAIAAGFWIQIATNLPK